MGGGDGVVIIDDGIKAILNNPLVHGKLPAGIQQDVGDTTTGPLSVDPGTWSVDDRRAVHNAMSWALKNIKR